VDNLSAHALQCIEIVEVIFDAGMFFGTSSSRSNNEQLPVYSAISGLQPGMLTLSTALRTVTGEKLITARPAHLTPCLQSAIKIARRPAAHAARALHGFLHMNDTDLSTGSVGNQLNLLIFMHK
jgi:hypothetical protein